MASLKRGDYVLATKYHDGDPLDHWVVGFFDSMLKKQGGDRYMVIDEDGNQFRGNGFRRARKISEREGRWLLSNAQWIEWSNVSVWRWLCRIPKQQLEE
jgi:hypothetical protein